MCRRRRQFTGSGTVGIAGWYSTSSRCAPVALKGRHRLREHLPVLSGGDAPGREGAAVLQFDHVVVDRLAGVAGPQKVGVHAVRVAPGTVCAAAIRDCAATCPPRIWLNGAASCSPTKRGGGHPPRQRVASTSLKVDGGVTLGCLHPPQVIVQPRRVGNGQFPARQAEMISFRRIDARLQPCRRLVE